MDKLSTLRVTLSTGIEFRATQAEVGCTVVSVRVSWPTVRECPTEAFNAVESKSVPFCRFFDFAGLGSDAVGAISLASGRRDSSILPFDKDTSEERLLADADGFFADEIAHGVL
jgi:hypothetical protein